MIHVVDYEQLRFQMYRVGYGYVVTYMFLELGES